MPPLITVIGSSPATLTYQGAGTNSIVQTPSGAWYCVYCDNVSDVAYRKSTDNGLTWAAPVTVFAGTVTSIAVHYDRWSDIAAGLIHIAYQESDTGDTLYRTIDTENSDALSTQTTIFAGTDTASGGRLSITRSRGGNVVCDTCIDGGVEGGTFKLLNANVPNGAWEAALASPEALATQDQIILVPGFAADNNDIMAIFWDASANQISRYIYDDSANTWAESIFTGNFIDQVAATAFPHFSAAVDLTNSQIILLAWRDNIDTANADLTCWTVTESAITAKTDVVTNSTDDQGLAALCIDTINGVWWAFYAGKSDGSETFSTAVKIYYKASKDGGVTWGAETQLTSTAIYIPWLITVPRLIASCPVPPPCFFLDNSNTALREQRFVTTIALPRVRAGL